MPIPAPLLRSALRFPGDVKATALANLRALRSEVVAAGVEAHLLTFVGGLADRSGEVPEFALVQKHYKDLELTGDANAYAGGTLLAMLEAAGLPQLAVSDYRHQLDEYRESTIADHLGVILQQVGMILTTGWTPPPSAKNRTPTLQKGTAAALQHLQSGMAAITGQFKGGDIEGTLRDLQGVFTRYQQRVGKPAQGVLTGWRAIDEAHHGLKPGDLCLILGFTSQMKSTFLWNLVYHASVWYGCNCGVYSMEMSLKALQDTFVIMHCAHPKWEPVYGQMLTITYDRLQRGELTMHEEQVVQAVIEDLQTNPSYGQILFKEPGADVTISEIRTWAEEKDQTVCKLDLLAIDYLALVNPSTGGVSMSDSAIANMAMREAKRCAMTFQQGRGIAIASPVQSNREGYKAAVKAGGRYELTALSWASEGEKSADLIYYVYLNESLRAQRQLQVGNLKARDRRLIVDTIPLMADPDLRIIEDFDPGNPRHVQVKL